MDHAVNTSVINLLTFAQRNGFLVPYAVDVPSFVVAPGQNVSVTHCAQANFWIGRILGGEAQGDSLAVQVNVAGIPLYPEAGQSSRVTEVDPVTGRWAVYRRPPEDRRLVLAGQDIQITIHGEPDQDVQDHMISIHGSQMDCDAMALWLTGLLPSPLLYDTLDACFEDE